MVAANGALPTELAGRVGRGVRSLQSRACALWGALKVERQFLHILEKRQRDSHCGALDVGNLNVF